MLGFGLTSTVLCIARGFAERHAAGIATGAAILFAPLLAGANLAAQQVPFNAVFIVADPQQKWRLLANPAHDYVSRRGGVSWRDLHPAIGKGSPGSISPT